MLKIAIVMMLVACDVGVFGQQAVGIQAHRLSLPDCNWALDVSLIGFDIPSEVISNDGHNYTLSAAIRMADGGVDVFSTLEIQIEPSQFQGDSVNMRDFLIKGLEKTKGTNTKRIVRGKIKTFEYNRIPISRYENQFELIPSLPLRLPQQSIEAYFVKNDVWILIRLSASSIGKDQLRLFNSLVDSVRIVDMAASPTSSSDFYQRGRSFYLQRKYSQAIEPLNTALKLERDGRRLDIARWSRLVQDLTDSYLAVDNINRAKETLEYGIGEEPTFPMFHLGLARLYATLGDLDNTIASLEQAFMHKANYRDSLGHVTSLPDPMFDARFERFKKDDRFRKAVKAMKK